jgi:hypothetical protein
VSISVSLFLLAVDTYFNKDLIPLRRPLVIERRQRYPSYSDTLSRYIIPFSPQATGISPGISGIRSCFVRYDVGAEDAAFLSPFDVEWTAGSMVTSSLSSIIFEAILKDVPDGDMSHASISSEFGRGEQNPILHCLETVIHPGYQLEQVISASPVEACGTGSHKFTW